MCALEPSRETYRILYEDNPSMYFAVAADGTVLSVNRYGADNLGYEVEDLLGSPVTEVFYPEDREAVQKQLATCCENPGEVFEWKLRKEHRAGHIMWVQEQARAVRDSTGTTIVLIVCEDITDRREAEEALRRAHDEMEQRVRERTAELRRSREHFRVLLESVQVIPWEMPVSEGRPTYVGPQAVGLMGYPRERWYEDGFWESLVHPEDLDEALAFYKEMGESSSGGEFEYRMLNSVGEIVWFRDVVSVTQPEDEIPILRGFMIDITIRKEAESKLRSSEAALLVSRQRLQDLAGRLLTAQEEERRRLAREIHDDLSQRIAGLASKTGYLEQSAAPEESLRTDQLKEVHAELVDLARDVRTLSRGLHPSMLEHLGLEDALRWECESFSTRTGVDVAFASNEVPADVCPQVGICLFRITQSALHNVQRHAETKSANVSLRGGEGELRLTIEDQGVGFENTGAEISNGMGLASMEERVRLVQGELQIETAPGEGTRVTVEVSTAQG